MAWFSFTGTNPNNPAHYTLVTSQPLCPGTEKLCAIQALNDGSNNPVISDPLQDEITQALQDGVPSTNVKLKDK